VTGGSNSNTSAGSGGSGGGESPRPQRKRFGSASEETILKVRNTLNNIANYKYKYLFNIHYFLQQVNGDGLSLPLSELENMKAEILREVRLEINKAKQEIIDGLYLLFFLTKLKN